MAIAGSLHRIEELKEEKKTILNSKIGIDLSYDDYIPKQKVKDKIEELEKAKRETIRENWHYIYSIQLKILEELLEDK